MKTQSVDEKDFFTQGREACRAYYASQAFAGLTRDIDPKEALKLFWPPVEEMQIMVSTPLPKPRQKWIAGFKKEKAEILEQHIAPPIGVNDE